MGSDGFKPSEVEVIERRHDVQGIKVKQFYFTAIYAMREAWVEMNEKKKEGEKK